ncbi:hypothetical protein ACHWQZ_G016714 [Mnemiopsis leidyi]
MSKRTGSMNMETWISTDTQDTPPRKTWVPRESQSDINDQPQSSTSLISTPKWTEFVNITEFSIDTTINERLYGKLRWFDGSAMVFDARVLKSLSSFFKTTDQPLTKMRLMLTNQAQTHGYPPKVIGLEYEGGTPKPVYTRDATNRRPNSKIVYSA